MALLNFKKEDGFGMIEVIISIFIASILLLAFSSMLFYSVKASRLTIGKLGATLYLREMIEVAKDLEKTDWDELDPVVCDNTDGCHPEVFGASWVLEDGPDSTVESGAYTRSMLVEPVFRDAVTNEIAETGVLDINTKKVTATITWNNGAEPYTTTLETYVYNI